MGESDYGFHFEFRTIQVSAFLLGANFNTNKIFGKREFYLMVYLLKFQICIGWFTRYSNLESGE